MMARVERIALRFEPMSLLSGPVVLSELSLLQPRVLLERDADGHGNWQFAGPADVPRVDRLIIEDGVVRPDRIEQVQVTAVPACLGEAHDGEIGNDLPGVGAEV